MRFSLLLEARRWLLSDSTVPGRVSSWERLFRLHRESAGLCSTCINHLSSIFWVTCYSLYISIRCFTLCFYVRDGFFLKPHEPNSASFQVFFCDFLPLSIQFSSVPQLCPALCDSSDCSTPGLPSITNSRSSLKLMSVESVMPSNHLILCRPLLLLPSIFPSIRVFSNESVLRIRWPKYWSFSFSISPSNEYSGLISFRMDRLDLLALHGSPSLSLYIIVRAYSGWGFGWRECCGWYHVSKQLKFSTYQQ